MRPALVVPAHDDAAPLGRLLDRVAGLGCFGEVVVVDDGSPEALREGDLARPGGPPVTLMRHDTPRGAGAARNRGLEAVSREHVIFFDADDDLLPEMGPLLAALVGREFDFCLYRHLDSRVRAEGGWGQTRWDDAHWEAAGAGMGALRDLPLARAPRLARIAAYPWNKVYRTAFLREARVRCTEIPVHNDIELHWTGFMAARRILHSDRIAAEHLVHPAGTRLSNRRGADRLRVFAALEAVATRIGPRHAWRLSFLAFVLGLIRWVGWNLDPAFGPELDRRRRAFLADLVDDATVVRLAATDPELAREFDEAVA